MAVEICGIIGTGGLFFSVAPGATDIEMNREGWGSWEDIEVSKVDGGYQLKFRESNRLLCATPYYTFETRDWDKRGAWETFQLFWTPDKSRILAVCYHFHNGRKYVSPSLTLIRR